MTSDITWDDSAYTSSIDLEEWAREWEEEFKARLKKLGLEEYEALILEFVAFTENAESLPKLYHQDLVEHDKKVSVVIDRLIRGGSKKAFVRRIVALDQIYPTGREFIVETHQELGALLCWAYQSVEKASKSIAHELEHEAQVRRFRPPKGKPADVLYGVIQLSCGRVCPFIQVYRKVKGKSAVGSYRTDPYCLTKEWNEETLRAYHIHIRSEVQNMEGASECDIEMYRQN